MIRVLTTAVALCLTLHAGAATGVVHSGIKALFDQYHYTMQVEWNQQDAEVPAMAKAELAKGLEALRTVGVSDKEIAEGALAQIKDARLQAEMQQVLKLSSATGMTPQETEKFAFDAIKASYVEGANWSGEGTYTVLGVAIFFALIALLAVTSEQCPDEGTCYECDLAYDECP